MGIGQSTILGIGGDPIVGTNHRDALALFEADDSTDMIVMVGEIGGNEEELAAEFITTNITKPVIGYIAGLTAPEGKAMGHAGAIISGNSGTAQSKIEALEAAGVRVGKNPTEVARFVAEARGVATPA
jgi:succinyl-CoA synthetase alpha subunit